MTVENHIENVQNAWCYKPSIFEWYNGPGVRISCSGEMENRIEMKLVLVER